MQYRKRITIVGSRGTGKTTYLAGLAYWPQRMKKEGKNCRFNVYTPDKNLQRMAANILLKGADMEPTRVTRGVYELPTYSLKMSVKNFRRQQEDIFIEVKDYPGGVFDQIPEISESVRKEYMQECLKKSFCGCLILIDKWEPGSDREYCRNLQYFLSLMDVHQRSKDLRVAIAMSKIERGEIWPGRIEPERDIFDEYLPGMTNTLRGYLPQRNLKFFAISTFGIQSITNPRPNRKDIQKGSETRSVLKIKEQGDRWQPYGMFAPLYWLATGNRINTNL